MGKSDSSPARRAIERIGDPLLALDTGWTVSYSNRSARERFDAYTGDALSDSLPAVAAERVRNHCTVSLRTGESLTFDLSLDDRYTVRTHPDDDEVTLSFRLSDTTDVAVELKERAIHEAPVGITIADARPDGEPLSFVNESFEDLTGYSADEVLGRDCRFLQGDDSDPDAVAELRRAIDAEEPTSVELVNYRKDGEAFWNRVDVAPIRDEEGDVSHYVGFQLDVTERRRAEQEAQRRADRLEHLLARIEGLLADVTTAVMGAETRAEIETVVCEELAAAEPYDCALIGERDIRTGGIAIREQVGLESTTGWDATNVDAAVVERALETEELQVSEDGRTVTMALRSEDVDYGVLVVRAAPGTFNEHERIVLESLVRAISSAIHARETQRLLVDDRVVEAEFSFDDDSLSFVGIARETDAVLTYRGSFRRDDGALVVLYAVAGSASDTVMEAASTRDDVAEANLVAEHDGGALVEFVIDSKSVVETMSDYGGKTQAIVAAADGCRMVVEFPQDADVRALLDQLQERYPATELVALRSRERPARTKQEFLASVADELTDRQRTALQKAYVGGFFDWPRPVTGDELAASMNISRSTFHEHLRAAHRKLCAQFFDNVDTTPRDGIVEGEPET